MIYLQLTSSEIKIRLPLNSTTTIIDLIQRFYAKTSAHLKSDPLKASFPTTQGVRQGGIEAVPLFCIFLDHVMKIYEDQLEKAHIQPVEFKYHIHSAAITRQQRTQHPVNSISSQNWLRYADDTTLYQTSEQNLEKSLKILAKIYNEYGLKLNKSKTKTMIYNCSQRGSYPDSIIKLDQENIENVKVFKVLVSNVQYNDTSTGEFEINSRIEAAKSKFAQYSKTLTNQKIYLKTRMKFYNAFVKSNLTYACSSWNLKSAQTSKIDAAHIKLLRRMVGGGWRRKNGSYSLVKTNKTIYKICGERPLSKFISQQQLKFTAHICRQNNNVKTKQLSFNNDKYKRPGQRTKNLFEQVIKNENIEGDHLYRNSLERKF